MKILKLTAENIKKLKVVDITPVGNVVNVTGKNASGKTSVLDSIWWALAGQEAVQGKPIREGEEKASIRLDLGDLIVERKFTKSATTLVVTNKDGAKYGSPQTMLDKLIGQLAFDPLDFTRMKPAEQYQLLRTFVSDIDFEAVGKENKADYDKRTEVNRKQKEALAEASAIIVPDNVPDKAEDEAALIEVLQNAADTNEQINAAARNRKEREDQADRMGREVTAITSSIEELKSKIADLCQRKDELIEKAAKERKELAAMEPLPAFVDTSEVRARITAARAANELHAKRNRKDALIKLADEKSAESAAITSRMEARTQALKDAVAAAKMPIDGLGFEEGRVTMGGIPFEQTSSAEQLKASVSIAMAMNPKLRVIRIKDGSLLDDTSMGIIKDFADKNDFQIWIESVNSTGKVGIYMEEGEVVAVND